MFQKPPELMSGQQNSQNLRWGGGGGGDMHPDPLDPCFTRIGLTTFGELATGLFMVCNFGLYVVVKMAGLLLGGCEWNYRSLSSAQDG